MRARPRLRRWAIAWATALAILLPPGPAVADVAEVLLEVPWRTQIDGLPDQRDNAALAGLGMVLAAYGRGATTAQLRQQHDLLVGEPHAPVTLASLTALAVTYGLLPQAPAEPERPPAEELRRQLAAGRPVLLSLGRGTPPAGERWVVAVGFRATGEIIYNDPGVPVPLYGQLRVFKPAEEQAWLSRGGPAVALALAATAAPPEVALSTASVEAGEPDPTAPAGPGATDAPAAGADPSPPWWRKIEAYARWFGLDPYYVAAVVLAESRGNPQAVGDQGHSVGLMQLHDAGYGAGLRDLRYDPLLNLWHGTLALAEGMAKYGDPYEAYARHYNPGGYAAGERVMAWYEWLRQLGGQISQTAAPTAESAPASAPATGGNP